MSETTTEPRAGTQDPDSARGSAQQRLGEVEGGRGSAVASAKIESVLQCCTCASSFLRLTTQELLGSNEGRFKVDRPKTDHLRGFPLKYEVYKWSEIFP